MAEDIVQSAIDNTLQNTVHDVLQNRRIHRSTDIETEGQEASRNVIETSVQEAGSIFISNATNELLTNSGSRVQNVLSTYLATVLTRSSPVQQVGIGFGSGWVSGYLFRKVSRTAAFVVGCGFLAIQAATALGIITIDWQRMRSLAQNIRRLESTVMSDSPPNNELVSLTDKIVFIFQRHMYLSSGFISGLIVGLTF